MAKIGVKIGFTFRIGALDTNQYGRMDMEVHDIDTELSIDDQLKDAGLAIDKVYKTLLTKVDSEIEDIMSESKEAPNNG